MRPISAIGVNSVEEAVRLRELGVDELTLLDNSDGTVNWELYHRVALALGTSGLGVIIRCVADVRRISTLANPPDHIGCSPDYRWRPEVWESLVQTGLPLRIMGLGLELEDPADWVVEQFYSGEEQVNYRIIFSILSDFRDAFRNIRYEFGRWKDGPSITEIRDIAIGHPVSICTWWQFRKHRSWFLGKLPLDMPVSLLIHECSMANYLPGEMTLDEVAEFLTELRRMDARRAHFAEIRSSANKVSLYAPKGIPASSPPPYRK